MDGEVTKDQAKAELEERVFHVEMLLILRAAKTVDIFACKLRQLLVMNASEYTQIVTITGAKDEWDDISTRIATLSREGLA